jgi:hypothetical protein
LLETIEPLSEPEFGAIVVMMRGFVEGLEERGVDHNNASRTEHPMNLCGSERWSMIMLESVHRDDRGKRFIFEREGVCVADQVGVAKNRSFQLNAMRIPPL